MSEKSSTSAWGADPMDYWPPDTLDEGVEAVAKALFGYYYQDVPWEDVVIAKAPIVRQYREQAQVAITAYLASANPQVYAKEEG